MSQAQTTSTRSSSLGATLGAIGRHRVVWPLAALALLFIVDFIISPSFFNIRIVEGRLFGSLIDIPYRAAPTALVALGMAVVIGTKGIDLSVGSIVAIGGAVITWRIHAGDPHLLILFIALAVGLLCGLWNGFLVAALDIQPIIATLILMVSGRGIGLMINLLYGGTDPSFTSPLLQGLSTGHIGYIPTRLLVFVFIFALLWTLLRRTALGLFLESVGGNTAAAYLTGINARMVIFSAYVISGLMASSAGVILTADTHTSDPISVALNIELDAILAVVIGGASLGGGRIYLGMTILGALVIQSLTTTILTSGMPPEYNLVVKAVVVVVVLLLQSSNFRSLTLSILARRKR
ncbi:MAG: ABC transporter permease [Bradyrhizobium sp.]|nr:MAG: ABC transporter permease [Bradyrhizobium sp.]